MRLVTANTYTDTAVRHAALPKTDLYRVFESTLQTAIQQMLTKNLKVEQRAHWLLIQQEPVSCSQ